MEKDFKDQVLVYVSSLEWVGLGLGIGLGKKKEKHSRPKEKKKELWR